MKLLVWFEEKQTVKSAGRHTSSLHSFVAVATPQCSQCACNWEITATRERMKQEDKAFHDLYHTVQQKLTSRLYSDANAYEKERK